MNTGESGLFPRTCLLSGCDERLGQFGMFCTPEHYGEYLVQHPISEEQQQRRRAEQERAQRRLQREAADEEPAWDEHVVPGRKERRMKKPPAHANGPTVDMTTNPPTVIDPERIGRV